MRDPRWLTKTGAAKTPSNGLVRTMRQEGAKGATCILHTARRISIHPRTPLPSDGLIITMPAVWQSDSQMQMSQPLPLLREGHDFFTHKLHFFLSN